MERGVSKVIGGDPKGNNFLYTNGKSVVIRDIDVSLGPFIKTGAANLFKYLTIIWLYMCKRIK